MTKILDLGTNPVLGRIHAINRKHRLRSKHWAEIEDWPASGATIDVLDPAALDAADHYPCADEVLVVSTALRDVLHSVDDSIQSFELDAGGRTVHVVLPCSDDDVMYESDGFTKYSKSGYTVADGINMRVVEDPSAPFCEVRNTGLLAISSATVDAANAAGIRWNLQDVVEHYQPFRPHPYFVYRTGYACAVAESLEATSEWPETPALVDHPLGPNAHDEDFDGDPNQAWTKRAANTSHADDCAFVRYCSGLGLPAFAATLDDDCAKSKRKKRWKETTAAGCLHMDGLPCVSARIRDELLGAGVEATFDPVTVTDTTLGESTEFFLLTPNHVVDWIDWPGSDVGLLWNGLYEEYFDLQPTEASYSATVPLVRVAGSNLVLVHESLVDKLTDSDGFYMTPLHECGVARNLDDSISAT